MMGLFGCVYPFLNFCLLVVLGLFIFLLGGRFWSGWVFKKNIIIIICETRLEECIDVGC